MNKLFTAVLIACSLASCGPSTKLTQSWKAPGAVYKKSEPGKTLIIAMVKDDLSRRVIEDKLAERIGPSAMASYDIFTDDMLKSLPEDVFADKIKREGYKYVLMMRLADIEKETTYTPGTTTMTGYGGYYGGYGRYYGYGASMYTSPGYYSTDKNYIVETTAYSVDPDKLLWSGTTKTVNPKDIDRTINDIANAVSDRMKSDGFLVK